ncbi:hypothetical protein KI387_035536, partial [Taxus chinensis]
AFELEGVHRVSVVRVEAGGCCSRFWFVDIRAFPMTTVTFLKMSTTVAILKATVDCFNNVVEKGYVDGLKIVDSKTIVTWTEFPVNTFE